MHEFHPQHHRIKQDLPQLTKSSKDDVSKRLLPPRYKKYNTVPLEYFNVTMSSVVSIYIIYYAFHNFILEHNNGGS